MKRTFFIASMLLCMGINSQAKDIELTSPDGKTRLVVNDDLTYDLYDGQHKIIDDACLSMTFQNGTTIGSGSKIKGSSIKQKKENIVAPFYRVPEFNVTYNELTIKTDKRANIIFRLYNDGMAYRFVTQFKNPMQVVVDEVADFNFVEDYPAWLPYSTNDKNPMAMAFQATYGHHPLSKAENKLAFLPVTVDCGSAKVTLMESDLESYPGMFVKAEDHALKAKFAPYPTSFDKNAWRCQRYVTAAADYIAKSEQNRAYPWRVLGISRKDTDMPVNNLVYALASPNRIGDTSWIKPGKVAWDWWNDWGISNVDFKAGINMETYKYYIDFASKFGLEYIVLDEGWYAPKSGDMLTTIPEINLPELVEYGRKKNVGIVLWTVFNVLDEQLEEACRKYSEMGIKGFKIDFLDRDDQEAVEMVYRIAEATAKYHLFIDLHGIYKPTGFNRTYPHIINIEAVFGMEEAKWSKASEKDMPLYDVTFPFIRQQSGFVDFTPGGMRNASAADFQPVYANPMTMGTRCHQLAMYVVYDSPFTMLADNPTAYMKEEECTRFMASMPTVFDSTIIPMGEIGKFIVTARQQGDKWYVGGMTNWVARDLTLSLDFLSPGRTYKATIMRDGINADKIASDYIKETKTVTSTTKLPLHLASGGGFAIIIE